MMMYYVVYTEAWDAAHGFGATDVKPAGMMVAVEDYISITYIW
jgi:hypothetical protein